MKNKLTTEEQLLQSKLNEAKFSYQEADWKQIESVVAEKGFLANYGTFLKAAAAFLVLTSAVYVVNSKYQKSDDSKAQVIEVQDEKTATIEEKAEGVKKDITSKESLATDNAPTKEASTTKRNVPNTSAVNKISNDDKSSFVEPKANKNIIEKSTKTNAKGSTTPVTLETKEIRVLGAPCKGEKVTLELVVRGFYTEDMEVEWKVNGKQLKGNEPKTELELSKVGQYDVSAMVYHNGNNIASNTTNFVVNKEVALDFTAEDLKSPFNDEKVRLKIVQPVEGKYVWYENRNSDKLLSGKEVEWAFTNEGRHNMTVEYTSTLGCLQKKTKEVEMDIFFTQEVFPNAFTPDNNGNNDVLEFSVLKPYSFNKYELIVHDMNNKIIFQTNVQEENWNGRFQNTGEMLSGKFAWVVKVENEKGEKRTFNGKGEIR